MGPYDLFKGLRPVLEGIVVTIHEGVCETGSQIPRPNGLGIGRTVLTSRVHCDNKPRQIGLNHVYNMTFSISPREFMNIVIEARAIRMLLPLLHHP